MHLILCERFAQILLKKGLFLLLCLLLLLSVCLFLLFFFRFCFFYSFSPTFLLLFALFAFYFLFAIGTALFEVFKHRSAKRQQQKCHLLLPRAHRLRPLLFVTCAVSLLGFPPLFLLPFLCRHFSSFLPSSFPFCPLFALFCPPSTPFFPLFLSLLITAFIPLRPLLQRQLAKMREDVVWAQFICQNDSLVVITLFNQFTGLMDRIEKDQKEEEKALFKEWRRKIGVKLGRHNEEESAQKWKVGKGTAKSGDLKAKKGKQMFQFSEVSLIREVTVKKPNIFHFGQISWYLGETVYVDFVHDFRVRMNSFGRIVPNSIRQIPYNFATSESIYYYANRRKKNRGKKTRRAKSLARQKMSAAEERSGYATIGGDEEQDKMLTMPFQQMTATVQLRPRLPTTPIPRSLPVSLLASPSTPQQQTEFMNGTTAAKKQSARSENLDEKSMGKSSDRGSKKSSCLCPFGTECQALAHLKMDEQKQ